MEPIELSRWEPSPEDPRRKDGGYFSLGLVNGFSRGDVALCVQPPRTAAK